MWPRRSRRPGAQWLGVHDELVGTSGAPSPSMTSSGNTVVAVAVLRRRTRAPTVRRLGDVVNSGYFDQSLDLVAAERLVLQQASGDQVERLPVRGEELFAARFLGDEQSAGSRSRSCGRARRSTPATASCRRRGRPVHHRRRPSARSSSDMPHSLTIRRASWVAFCRSSPAPDETTPNTRSSALRPPSIITIMFSACFLRSECRSSSGSVIVTPSAMPGRNDRHLVERVVAGEQRCTQGVAGLVVRGHLPFLVGHDERIALDPHDHPVTSHVEVVGVDLGVAAPHGVEGSFVDEVGEVGTAHAGSTPGDDVDVDVVRHPLVLDVDGEDLLAILQLRKGHHDLPVETSGSQEGRVEDVGAGWWRPSSRCLRWPRSRPSRTASGSASAPARRAHRRARHPACGRSSRSRR